MRSSEFKIGVIGSEGFLGMRLQKRFLASEVCYQGFDISISEASSARYMDVEDASSLDKLSDCSTIINLAAVHRDDIKPETRYDDVNVQGAINICNAARLSNVKHIIFTSSVAIYGFSPEGTDESGDPNYFNNYGRTKYLAEEVYKDWQLEEPEDRSLVIVRPTVIFGEGNRGNVYNLLNQIASKKFAMFGAGDNRKSMAYVENVAAFIEYSLSLGKGVHIFNYIDKPDFDMNGLVSFSRKVLFNKNNVGLRLPCFIGTLIGYCCDLVSKLIRRPLPISSIRVKKFMATTVFSSKIDDEDFGLRPESCG